MALAISNSVSPDEYDESYFINICGGGECFYSGDIDTRLKKAFNDAKVKKDDVILDIGGGRGELSALCAKEGCKVYLIDYSAVALKISESFLKKSLSAEEFKKIKINNMDAKNLGFDDETFDKIFILEVIEHLYPDELDIVFSEIKRVVKSNGVIIISTGPNAILSIFLIFLAKNILRIKNFDSRRVHVNEQTYFSLTKLLKKHNLKYTIEIENSRDFFYGQIAKNNNYPQMFKYIIKYINKMYDSFPVMVIRNTFPVNIIVGTNYWVIASKREKKDGNVNRMEKNRI